MLEILTQTATGTSSLASTTVTFSNNNVGGNSIIVCVGDSSTTADVSGVTDSQGNTYLKAFANQNALLGDLELWYASNIIGGANTITVAYTTGVSCAVIAREYYGTVYQISNMLDQQTSATGNSAALSSGNTGQTIQNYELLIGVGLIPLTDTFTAGAGYVNLITLNGPTVVQIAMEDQMITSSGLQVATFGANTGLQWVCGIGTFLLAPTGTTTSTSFTTSTSISSTSASSTSSSISSTSSSTSVSSTSVSMSITTISTSSTSTSQSSTSISSTSSSTSISSTSTSISSTSTSSTSQSSTSTSTSISSTSTSFSSTSSSVSSTSFSISSTSASSTSSSSSTSTTTLPPPYDTYTYQDQYSYTVVQQFSVTSPTSWLCPANVTSVLAECWGGGGGGGDNGSDGGGGGGGAYSNAVVSVVPGTSYTVTVGAGGAGSPGGVGNTGGTGGNSSFVNTSTVLAVGGTGATDASSAGGAGGAAASGVGTITTSGGTGGAGSGVGSGGGGGGGGGAGSLSNGGTGGLGSSTGGIAGNAGAVVGGQGGSGGTEGSGNVGNPGLTIGGGGGGGAAGNTGGNGAAGFVQLTYTVVQNPQANNTNLLDSFNAVNYSNVSTRDSDYFTQYGSTNILAQFIQLGPNNTDNLIVKWYGRSTVSPTVSPVWLQVYNYNTPGWETWAAQTIMPADTDFLISATISTNQSNYYGTQNQVSVRVYQLVV